MAHAQNHVVTLRQALEAAWTLSPSSRAAANRQAELQAKSEAARSLLAGSPGLIIYPGICLIVCCAGFNLLGEGLRDAIGKEDEISAS